MKKFISRTAIALLLSLCLLSCDFFSSKQGDNQTDSLKIDSQAVDSIETDKTAIDSTQKTVDSVPNNR